MPDEYVRARGEHHARDIDDELCHAVGERVVKERLRDDERTQREKHVEREDDAVPAQHLAEEDLRPLLVPRAVVQRAHGRGDRRDDEQEDDGEDTLRDGDPRHGERAQHDEPAEHGQNERIEIRVLAHERREAAEIALPSKRRFEHDGELRVRVVLVLRVYAILPAAVDELDRVHARDLIAVPVVNLKMILSVMP